MSSILITSWVLKEIGKKQIESNQIIFFLKFLHSFLWVEVGTIVQTQFNEIAAEHSFGKTTHE
jgi:hypothetical protein